MLSFWRRQWHPTPVRLPGKSHGQRSLVGCSPWGLKESDSTGQLHFHFSVSCIGEGNGNPLQCSCLENPRDGGAWWEAVYGVTQSRTRLKWLSSSNSMLSFRLNSAYLNSLGCTSSVVPIEVFVFLAHISLLVLGRNFFFLILFFFKLYIIVLVLPNIKMNPPQVYMCSPLGRNLIAQLVKNLPAVQETPVWFLGQEDPLEKG